MRISASRESRVFEQERKRSFVLFFLPFFLPFFPSFLQMERLPQELLLRLVLLLDVEDVMSLCCTSRRLRAILDDPFVVKSLAKRDFILEHLMAPQVPGPCQTQFVLAIHLPIIHLSFQIIFLVECGFSQQQTMACILSEVNCVPSDIDPATGVCGLHHPVPHKNAD